jgi:hypothetical protein
MDVSSILKGEDSGRWYPVTTNGGPEEPRVRIRVPSPKKLRELAKIAGVRPLGGRLGRQELENKRLQDELVDHMILEWTGITDGESDLPCNRENKIELVDEWFELYTLVFDVLDMKRTQAVEIEEIGRGN